MRTVHKCPCGDAVCDDYHVSCEAHTVGVSFTERQALAVAALLDAMDDDLSRIRLMSNRPVGQVHSLGVDGQGRLIVIIDGDKTCSTS